MSAADITAKRVKFCMITNYRHKLHFYITHLLCCNWPKDLRVYTGNSHNRIRLNKLITSHKFCIRQVAYLKNANNFGY
jgi:hypothetical protein